LPSNKYNTNVEWVGRQRSSTELALRIATNLY